MWWWKWSVTLYSYPTLKKKLCSANYADFLKKSLWFNHPFDGGFERLLYAEPVWSLSWLQHYFNESECFWQWELKILLSIFVGSYSVVISFFLSIIRLFIFTPKLYLFTYFTSILRYLKLNLKPNSAHNGAKNPQQTDSINVSSVPAGCDEEWKRQREV